MDFEIKKQLEAARKILEDLRESLDFAGRQAQIAELEEVVAQPGFWDKPDEAQQIMQKITGLRSKMDQFNAVQTLVEDAETLYEMFKEMGDDEELLKETGEAADKATEALEKMELETLLNGKYDRNNAIISIHPGAGGTESQDWADMLYRMYVHWAEKNGFGVTLLDYLAGEEAGIKSVTLLIKGENAFGYLKAEKGVHRLVRISPFDSAGRRHTSFTAVEVMPEVEHDNDIQIDEKDLKVDTYRSTGAGGQHINTTDSAVRITHMPTGIVVQCQTERSQIQNRATCMKMLTSRLVELKIKEHEQEMAALQGEQQDIGWGSQIRSYVFHPYSMAKDHRTNIEKGNIQAVMDGDIQDFIQGYLKQQAAKAVRKKED
ncbi:MAG: peptide chain release factor 2 [Peptococcaceae bacterium]|nr:peptide chain release factor 2 [Peptococcaceae bacterium]